MADTPPTGADQAAQNDALALLTTELGAWGFGQDAVQWAAAEIASNKSTNQILADLRAQDFYKNSIFGQVSAARQGAGLAAMTEAQILAYKDQAQGIAQQAGLPTGFVTDAEITSLMKSDVSISEWDQRVTQGYVKAANAPPETRAQLAAWGVDMGHLAAYYTDPTRALPFLQTQFQAAQLGAASTRTGYGTIDEATATQLAQMGVTESQGQTSFGKLAGEQQLFNALPGSGEQGISQQIQLAAEFGGNAADQQAITQRAAQRTATFAAGGSFEQSAGTGVKGMGPARGNG